MTDAGPVSAADLDALEGPLRRFAAVVKARTLLAKDVYEAMKTWAGEVSAATGARERSAADKLSADRLPSVADAFAAVSKEYVGALLALDTDLRGLLVRASVAGLEPSDEVEAGEALRVLATMAGMGRGQLDRLPEVSARMNDELHPPELRDSLRVIFAAVTLMEKEEQPVLDEWERLIRLIPVGD